MYSQYEYNQESILYSNSLKVVLQYYKRFVFYNSL